MGRDAYTGDALTQAAVERKFAKKAHLWAHLWGLHPGPSGPWRTIIICGIFLAKLDIRDLDKRIEELEGRIEYLEDPRVINCTKLMKSLRGWHGESSRRSFHELIGIPVHRYPTRSDFGDSAAPAFRDGVHPEARA